MLAKDHRLLGEYLASQLMEQVSPLRVHLFLTGCVFPDHNPETYLKGLCIGHPLKTHFYRLSRKKIERLCKKLEQKETLRLFDYYTLGTLTHFLADAFTFPHNDHFGGNMLDHAYYERSLLHPAIEQYIIYQSTLPASPRRSGSLLAAFHLQHQGYLNTPPSPQCDAEHIVNICTLACALVLSKHPIWEQPQFLQKEYA